MSPRHILILGLLFPSFLTEGAAQQDQKADSILASRDELQGTRIVAADARLTGQGVLLIYKLSDKRTAIFDLSTLEAASADTARHANYVLLDAKGRFLKAVYNGATYTEATLLNALQGTAALSEAAGRGFNASKVRAIEFNLFDGSVTFRDNKRVQATLQVGLIKNQ